MVYAHDRSERAATAYHWKQHKTFSYHSRIYARRFGRAEISVEHLKQVERGKKMLSVESLVNVANALQVSVDSLVYEQTINSAKNDIAQMLVSIDSEDSQRLLGLIRYVNDNFLKKM